MTDHTKLAVCRKCGNTDIAPDRLKRNDFICQVCNVWYKKFWYEQNKESISEREKVYRDLPQTRLLRHLQDIKRNRTPKVRERKRIQFQKRMANPIERGKILTRERTRKLISGGHLKRKPCEVCGDPNSQAHHNDYNNPKDIRWFCRIHHMIYHGRYKLPV